MVGPCWLSILYIVACICYSQALDLSIPSTFSHFGNHKFVFSIWQSVSILKISWFVSFKKSDSTYGWYHMIFFFVWFSMLISRSIHVATNVIISLILFLFNGWVIYRWRRQWHPTPVLVPGKCHGRRRLEGCSPWGRWGSDTTERLHFHFSLSCIGEGNGNPLQCSCLENPRDWGAWWAAVYGVAQSQTWLKWLSSSSSSPKISAGRKHAYPNSKTPHPIVLVFIFQPGGLEECIQVVMCKEVWCSVNDGLGCF